MCRYHGYFGDGNDGGGSEVAGVEILIKEVGSSSASDILLKYAHVSVPWHLNS